ncbi:UNVERIFIED_CONTAM: hypothetical protein RF648_18845, partial [Kocuria sp. CPCC 205274]
TKAVFDLSNLINNNDGTKPVFNFGDENIFDIKVRFTIDGGTAPSGNHNMIFRINTGDAEPTIITFNDRNGANPNQGIVVKASMTTTGKLTLETTNVDGTAAGFSVINYPTMTVNQIQEFTISLASSLVTQGELSTTNGNVSANTAAIANANTAIGTKVATTDFEAFKTTNTAEINAKVAQTAYDTKMAALDASIASNTTAIATKAAQTAVDNLNGKPVRTIDAAGAEIGMSLGAYTTSALDNGLADRSVVTKLVNDALAPILGKVVYKSGTIISVNPGTAMNTAL